MSLQTWWRGPTTHARPSPSIGRQGGWDRPNQRMAKNPGDNLTNAVRETLDSVVSPSVRNEILDRALRAAHRPKLPSDREELGDFVQGPLHDTLVSSLGQELGASVASELERILAMAERTSTREPVPNKAPTVRPKRASTRPRMQAVQRKASRSTLPSPEALPPGSTAARDRNWADKERRGIAPTLPATKRVVPGQKSAPPMHERKSDTEPTRQPRLPASTDYPLGTARALGVIGTLSTDPVRGHRPTVFVASSDAELVRCFKAWLDLRASVEPVAGAAPLLAALAASGDRTVVVLDGKNPAIRPLTLAALAEELPETTSVLLWGVAQHVVVRMCAISSIVERWLVYAGHTTADEMVAHCVKMLD